MKSDTRNPGDPLTAAQSWRAVFILLFIYILSVLDRNIMTLLVTPIKASLDVTDSQMSLMIGLAFALFFAGFGLPLGWAVDNYPRRWVMAACIIFWSVGTAICGLAPTFALMFMARCMVGAGEGGVSPGSQSLLGDLFPPKKLGLPMAVFAMGPKLGGAASLIIGGGLTLLIPPTQTFVMPGGGFSLQGWQLIFLVIGLPGIALAFVTFLIREPPRAHMRGPKVDAGYGAYWKFFLQNPRLIACAHLGTFAFLASTLAVTSWLPAHFERTFQWEPSRIGGVFGLVLVAIAVFGGVFNGAIVDWLYQRKIRDIHLRYQVVAAIAGMPLGVAAFLVKDPILCMVLTGLFLLVISCYASMPMVMLQAIVPSHIRGKAAAVNGLVSSLLGTTIGPLIVGLFTDYLFKDEQKVGWSIALALAILLPMSAAFNGSAMGPLRRFTEKRDALQDREAVAQAGVLPGAA